MIIEPIVWESSSILSQARYNGLMRDLLAPGGQFGRFHIEAEVGHGSMGIVYRCHDPKQQQAVYPEADPDGISNEAIDGLIKRLRQRLRQTNPGQEYIEVVRGYGVRLTQAHSTPP